MKVLIADDDEAALLILEDSLREAGYDVITAHTAAEAIEAVRTLNIRLVVTDWDMPGGTGIELIQQLRNEEGAGYIYAILLTGRDTPQERVHGLRAGADDFVAKPFDGPELLARIAIGERVLSMETREVAIFAMAKLAESRDPETGAHLERVRSYSRILAQHLGGTEKHRGEITPEYARLIYLTSPLHDIGKVGIPDSVLLKPGRLNDREFEIMKMHASLGAQTLDAALRQFPQVKFLEMARDIALTHHERFDGSGYPNGLRGEDIPLAGRIVAVADVYDALTSRRVYKPAMAHDVAIAMIREESGTQFDPDVVDALLANEPKFQAVRDRHAENQAAAA
jgi:putative two-component system response regulator